MIFRLQINPSINFNEKISIINQIINQMSQMTLFWQTEDGIYS